MGFSLELEGNGGNSDEAGPDAIPFPKARMASEGMAERAAETDGVPTLAPPMQRRVTAAKALRPDSGKFRIPKWSYFVAGGLVAGLVAYFVVFPMLRFAPRPEVVLRPFAADLAKDDLNAYRAAADRLIAAGKDYKNGVPPLRLRASELLLLSVVVHGDEGGKLATAEQAQAGLPSEPKLATEQARVRALLALAKGRGREVEGLLSDRNATENQLIIGLSRLSEGKLTSAVEILRKYVAAREGDLAGHYVLGRALADTAKAEAVAALTLVRTKNPNHVGAAIALAGLETTPEKRLAAAQALLDKQPKAVGKREWAELHHLLGQASMELGKRPESVAALQKAVAEDPAFLPAHVALGEALLYLGNYDEALRRLKIPGDGVLADPSAKFAMAGALIATANWDQGLALLKTAMQAHPDDPRGPYWQGFYATQKKPVDLVEAEQGYRDALKREPKFLPASLSLATLLQQSNRAEESLKILREAEEAGAPVSVLQMAWGAALVIAKEPVKAEAVYRKILEADPTSVTAVLGVSAALTAQKQPANAKHFLEGVLKDHPELPSLRERLAEISLDLGEKAEALTRYQEEIQAGRATVALRLKAARLAIDLGKLDLALSESRKALEEQPRGPEATFLIGRVNETRGEKSQALAEYRRAVGWDPTPEYAHAYGRMLVKLGKEQEAMLFLSKAESIPQARLERGRLYFRKGEVDKANADFQAAAAGLPDQVEPFLLQAMCFDKLGQKDKAELAWRSALKINPDEPESHYRLGRQEMDRGKPALALDHLRKAANKLQEKTSWESDLYFQLGQGELLSGSKPAALAAFLKYLEVAPDDAPARPEAMDQIKRLSPKK